MKICILAGEKSGDNYGALLCKYLKQLEKDIFIFGTGGEKMKNCGVELIEGMPFGKMGFTGVLKCIIPYCIFFKKVIKKIKKEKPDIVVLIDNPGFNLRVAIALKKKFKIYYYIPPKIWAHGYERIKILKKYVNGVIPIFSFEDEIYKKEKIPSFYFGHPVGDLIEEVNLSEKKEKIIIGILPGSREEELIYMLSSLRKILEKISKNFDFEILISAIDEKIEEIENKILKGTSLNYRIEKQLYYIIKNSDLILATSGTVNLEVAYFEKPLIVFYKSSFLNYLIAKLVVKLKMISPVNIILGEKVVPEYIQNFDFEKIEKNIMDLIEKRDLYWKEKQAFKKIKEIIARKNVSENIAKFIIKEATC